MSSETPSLEECIAFMVARIDAHQEMETVYRQLGDESVADEHVNEVLPKQQAILGYLRDLAAARRDAQALREALRALIAKWDSMDETMIAFCTFAAIHGWEWPKDKNISAELAAGRAALAADEPK
jgi:hypothetical protein